MGQGPSVEEGNKQVEIWRDKMFQASYGDTPEEYQQKIEQYLRQSVDFPTLLDQIESLQIKLNREDPYQVMADFQTFVYELISVINLAVQRASDLVLAVSQGPLCFGVDRYLNDPQQCAREEGTWVRSISPPDPTLEDNFPWFDHVLELQNAYFKKMKQLKQIVTSLKRTQSLTESKVYSLAEKSEKLIEEMNDHLLELYQMVLKTPTYTPEESKQRELKREKEHQEYLALGVAQREAYNLPKERIVPRISRKLRRRFAKRTAPK